MKWNLAKHLVVIEERELVGVVDRRAIWRMTKFQVIQITPIDEFQVSEVSSKLNSGYHRKIENEIEIDLK